jgi:hypothetical protein
MSSTNAVRTGRIRRSGQDHPPMVVGCQATSLAWRLPLQLFWIAALWVGCAHELAVTDVIAPRRATSDQTILRGVDC